MILNSFFRTFAHIFRNKTKQLPMIQKGSCKMYCRSLVLLIRLFKCRLCCIDRMTCFVFDVCVISGECTSCKINHFITRQIINADSRSVSGKCIIQIIRRTAIDILVSNFRPILLSVKVLSVTLTQPPVCA